MKSSIHTLLRLSGILLSTAVLANCSSSSDNSAASPGGNSAAGAAPTYQLSQVRNRGVSNNVLSLELDGQFAGSNDVVTAACTTNANPVVSIVADSASQIHITLAPMDDTCSFSVQGATSAVPSIVLSSTTASVSAFLVQNLTLSADSSQLTVQLGAAFFNGNAADVVNYSCDGAPFQSAATTEQTQFIFTVASISIAAPQNPLTCQFYMDRSGVQSPITVAYEIAYANWGIPANGNIPLSLSGSFHGASDVVHLSCAGAEEQDFAVEQLQLDSAHQIVIQVPVPAASTTCQVSVTSGSLQSAVVEADYTPATVVINPFIF